MCLKFIFNLTIIYKVHKFNFQIQNQLFSLAISQMSVNSEINFNNEREE